MSVEQPWDTGRVQTRPVGGGTDGTDRPAPAVEVESHAPAAHVLAVLAARFPRRFTARAVASRLSAGDAELQHAFETVGFWRRRRVTGAVVGQWLGRLRDRAAGGRVLRPGRLIDGYRRYRITEAL